MAGLQQYFKSEINDKQYENIYKTTSLRNHFLNMQNILIVDDDDEIRSLLQRFLEQHGYAVATAASVKEAEERLASHNYDLVVLDVMLPGESGLGLCARLKATSKISIIMVTAVSETTDRIVGLELGADDYLSKPFDARELLARVRAVLRRAAQEQSESRQAGRPIVRFDGWLLDLTRRELRSPDKTLIPLSGGEFELLVVFVEHPQRILSRDQLLDLARGPRHDAFDRSIDVQVSRLRRKIQIDNSGIEIIRTIRNLGYMFNSPVEHL